MVSERATLLWVVLALIGIVFAVGAGPMAVVARQAASRAVLTPLVGLALCATLLTTATTIMTLRAAAYTVLLPSAAISLGVAAVTLWRRRGRPRVLGAAIPLAIALAALLIALAPGIATGSLGPFTGPLRDAWLYVSLGEWLQHHTIWDTPPDSVWVRNLIDATGWVGVQHNSRLGVAAVPPAIGSLLGLTTDEVLYPTIALQFAMLPLALWASARAIGLGRTAAGVAALLGLGTLPLGLVYDVALGNLAGLIFTPLTIAFGILAVRSGARSEIALAAIFAAGLVASYPEFVPVVVLVAAAGAMWLALRASRRRRVSSLASPARRAGLVALGVVVLSPFAVYRLWDYLQWAKGAAPTIVDRGLSPTTVGAWATGLFDTYRLGEIATMSPGMRLVLVAGPLVLIGLGVYGAFARRDAGDVVLVLVPVVMAVVLGVYVLKTGASGGDCQYCLGKALTFGFPSLAIGIGAGVQGIVLLARGRRTIQLAIAVPTVAVVAAMGIGMAIGTQRLSTTIVDTSAFVPPEVRSLTADGQRIGVRGGVFLEGYEATGDIVAFLPALYHAVIKMPGAYPTWDVAGASGYDLYLTAYPGYWGRLLPKDRYEDPAYRYVLSTYAGLDTGREVLARRGRYTLERRSPVDVTITRTAQVIGGPDRAHADAVRPIVAGPIQLRVAAPHGGPGHVTVTGVDPEPPAHAFLATADPTVSQVEHSLDGAGAITCFALNLRKGFTTFDVQPASGAPNPLTITRTRAGWGPCPSPMRLVEVPPTSVVGGDAFPLEPALMGGGPGQWIGTRSSLDILPNSPQRPATRVRLRMVSAIVPQTVTVRLDGRVVGRVVGSLDFAKPTILDVPVPPGRGPVRLTFTASPGAVPASIVNPDDTRKVAIALGPPQVQIVTGTG